MRHAQLGALMLALLSAGSFLLPAIATNAVAQHQDHEPSSDADPSRRSDQTSAPANVASQPNRHPLASTLRVIRESLDPRFNSDGQDTTLREASLRVAAVSPDLSPRASRLTYATLLSHADVQGEIQLLRALAERRKTYVEFLVATVPDPVESQVGWFFDPTKSAIVRALTALDFQQERYYLPWWNALTRNSSVATSDWWHYRQEPGIQVLRRLERNDANEPISRLMVVLMVGESPVKGVHKPALHAALDLPYRWQPVGGAVPDEFQLRLLGPTFSGSAISVRETLHNWLSLVEAEIQQSGYPSTNASGTPRVRCQVVSGSASDARTKALLETRTASTEVRFAATAIPIQVLNYLVLQKFLHEERRLDPRSVAMLVEGGTAYGNSVFRPFPSASSGDGHELLATPFAGMQDVLTIPYPIHVAHVRAAFERDPELRKAAGQMVSLPHLTIEPDLSKGSDAPDRMPVTSPLTAAVSERVLTTIMDSVARRGIKYLGIVGTDPLDKIFLARQVKRRFPDVQLFLFEGDLLLTHPSFARELEGTLVASTYPLFARSQAWCYPYEHQHRPAKNVLFSSHYVQGAYNAVLALCELDLAPRDSQGQKRLTQMLDYCKPFEAPVPFAKILSASRG